MDNKKEKKEQLKQLKLEQKRLRQERKASRVKPIIGRRNVEKPVKVAKSFEKEEIVKKTKTETVKVKEDFLIKKPLNQRLKSFPILLTREMRRVRWIKKPELARKFLITVAFITFFVIFFFIVQQFLQFILKLIYVL